jgi:hypothetical protein
MHAAARTNMFAVATVLALLAPASALAQRSEGEASRAEVRVADGLLARQADGTFEPVRFDQASAPFGLRHNNYVALKRPGSGGTWPGQVGANSRGYAQFDDPAYAVSAFTELMRIYHDRYGARSASDIFQRYSPTGDCSGAPSVPPAQRREGGGCPENETQAPINAARAVRAVGLRPGDELDLFGPGGEIRHHDRLRALMDAVVSQEIGAPYCPQPPREESWLGCHIDDRLYQRALELPRN